MAGVRLYASGQPGGARSDRLLYRAELALDDQARVKTTCENMAKRYGVKWRGRRYDPTEWDASDVPIPVCPPPPPGLYGTT